MGVWIETLLQSHTILDSEVTPCVGVWIETNGQRYCYYGKNKVTPCVGVWIETAQYAIANLCQESHPAWVCGLKLSLEPLQLADKVTPCVGVWIETENQQKPYTTLWVTPCVGVWIETENILYDFLLS